MVSGSVGWGVRWHVAAQRVTSCRGVVRGDVVHSGVVRGAWKAWGHEKKKKKGQGVGNSPVLSGVVSGSVGQHVGWHLAA